MDYDVRNRRITTVCRVLGIECTRDEEIPHAVEELQKAGFRQVESVTAPQGERDDWTPEREMEKYLAPENNVILLRYAEYGEEQITNTGYRFREMTARKVGMFVRSRVLAVDPRPVPFLQEAHERRITRTLNQIGKHESASVRSRVLAEALEQATEAESAGLRLRDELSTARLQARVNDPALREEVAREQRNENIRMEEIRRRDHELCIHNYQAWRMENK